MALPTWLLPGASAVFQTLGGLFANHDNRPIRPRESYFPYQETLDQIEADATRNANQQAANSGTLIGQRLLGRGQNNSAYGDAMISGAREDATQQALGSVENARLPLLQQKMQYVNQDRQRMDQYDQARRTNSANNWNILGGNVGGAFSSLGGLFEQQKQYQQQLQEEEAMRRWIEELLGGRGYGQAAQFTPAISEAFRYATPSALGY